MDAARPRHSAVGDRRSDRGREWEPSDDGGLSGEARGAGDRVGEPVVERGWSSRAKDQGWAYESAWGGEVGGEPRFGNAGWRDRGPGDVGWRDLGAGGAGRRDLDAGDEGWRGVGAGGEGWRGLGAGGAGSRGVGAGGAGWRDLGTGGAGWRDLGAGGAGWRDLGPGGMGWRGLRDRGVGFGAESGKRRLSGGRRRGLVVVAAVAGLVDLGLWALDRDGFGGLPAAYWLMGVLAVVVDARPYVVANRRASSVVLPSICFTFAIDLAWGFGAALAVQTLAVTVAGMRLRQPVRRVVHLAVQHAVALAAAAGVAGIFSLHIGAKPGWDDALLTVAAASAWILARYGLAAVVARLLSPPARRKRRRGVEVLATAALLLLGPVVLATAQVGLAFVPLVLLALHAVHRMVRSSGESERAERVDALTGLPNRRALAASLQERGQLALLLLDLDRFRTINDALGHTVGDRLLVEVARRLADVVPAHDLVVRLGGDEFAVLATRVDGAPGARRLAHHLVEALNRPFALDGVPIDMTASIGIALRDCGHDDRYDDNDDDDCDHGRLVDDRQDDDRQVGDRKNQGRGSDGRANGGRGSGGRRDGERRDGERRDGGRRDGGWRRGERDDEAMLREAEAAMYDAKQRGDQIAVYGPDAAHHSPDRLALLGDLRRALREGAPDDGIMLFYQPQIAIATGEVVGVEALLRWQHPERGMIGPEELIRVAEPTPAMRLLTERVLHDVTVQVARWRDAGRRLRASVNVSVRDLHSGDIAERIDELLRSYAVPADLLQLEITESALMADPHRVLKTITRLDRMGIAISLDDFGTGYSSLQHLRRLPLSEVKIDRSFVLGMASDRGDAAIVRSVIDLAEALGLRAVAEGVEDERTWRLLAAAGCHAAQGWFHARPMPAADLDDWLARYRPLRPVGMS
ncbi:bifunctional diguanylate cyclase/phosphodiesterase [Actinoplanes sp. TBRC 11911]|uniref:putative bifunctional diguanylate cyclase/phosphodiesterase n=1 Tax=Actinoplanes sp. TBRC 11911 TaxID=2729386 RepID=UPI0020070FEB|nr:bifunctional diguanylate cyclase/phosphodiesterase [Actinoplanes sp. TBRC 11911]